MSTIKDEYSFLLKTQWGFLHEDWPVINKTKFHRTEVKEVLGIAQVKSAILDKLGFIPTFFFLIQIFGTRDYGGPYRNVEKGLLLLYNLISGESMTQMARFMPKTSYYDLHKDFYLGNADNLYYNITSKLSQMCSSLRLRLLLAKNNPEPFKHVTLNLDGHDTRVSHIAADKPSLYSYKLKKSGFRVQVCTDMNNIVLFVSKPAPCRDYNDGTMLLKMNLASRIHKLDCIALDGGYNGFVNQIVESSDTLSNENFSCPVRKTKGIAKSEEENQYNNAFSGFRSKIESCFGDMQSTFSKFTHNAPIRFSDSKIFDLQYKLCCLLMNIKKIVDVAKIPTQTHHTFWMQDTFDFPNSTEHQMTYEKQPGIKVKLRYGQSLLEQQEAFMSEISSHVSIDTAGLADISMIAASLDEEYEVSKILDHQGDEEEIEFLVQWKGYDIAEATWEPLRNFKNQQCIRDYWKSKAQF
ncbi:hypothetical protein BGZ46_010401 [Entomortierella lignicola]|nr:hypothetical protein BGZ46_010401 [Entomortierella lignicola]